MTSLARTPKPVAPLCAVCAEPAEYVLHPALPLELCDACDDGIVAGFPAVRPRALEGLMSGDAGERAFFSRVLVVIDARLYGYNPSAN